MCLLRFDVFCTHVLGYQVMPFHADMIRHIIQTDHSMVLAPRGSGKSTIGDVAYCVWRILKNPNLRIAIASKSGPQAKGFLGEIKQHFESNTDFIKLFGDWVGTTWNEDEIVVSRRNRILKEPTITALGSGAGIPGRHFDLIIADDLVDLENSATEHQRDKTKAWFFSVLMPTLEPDTGELRVIGTRYHAADLYGHLAKKDRTTGVYTNSRLGPNTLTIGAIQLDPVTGEEISFWPEKFALATLLEMRKDWGMAIFSLQMQCDATITEGQIMKIEDIEPYVWSPDNMHPPQEELSIFIGVDPAISEKQAADFFALCVIGVHESRHIYVLEMVKCKIGFKAQVDLIVQKYRQWLPEKIGIETVAYQKALALEVKAYPWIPVLEVPTRKDKTTRARVFSAFVERHELHCHYQMIDLINTLVGMPDVEHDDDFDALDFAVEAAKVALLNSSIIATMPNNFRRR